VAGILALTGLYAYENRYRDLVVSVLRRNLAYLNLDEIDLYAFADEFVADRGTFGMRGHLLALAFPVLDRVDFLNPRQEQMERFEYRVVSRFLLSTDFFWNGADESRPIRYVSYNSPFQRACGNPFAQFEFDEG